MSVWLIFGVRKKATYGDLSCWFVLKKSPFSKNTLCYQWNSSKFLWHQNYFFASKIGFSGKILLPYNFPLFMKRTFEANWCRLFLVRGPISRDILRRFLCAASQLNKRLSFIERIVEHANNHLTNPINPIKVVRTAPLHNKRPLKRTLHNVLQTLDVFMLN